MTLGKNQLPTLVSDDLGDTDTSTNTPCKGDVLMYDADGGVKVPTDPPHEDLFNHRFGADDDEWIN